MTAHKTVSTLCHCPRRVVKSGFAVSARTLAALDCVGTSPWHGEFSVGIRSKEGHRNQKGSKCPLWPPTPHLWVPHPSRAACAVGLQS